MLKKIFDKEIHILKNRKNDDEPMMHNFRGELKVWGERNGEVIHYDEGHNVVTVWAKHATMHLITSESFSSHGNIGTNPIVYSKRSKSSSDHIEGTLNKDGTLISGEQYLGDNLNYNKYWSAPSNLTVNQGIGDSPDGFEYPFFPTKMLFGTGVEYANWAGVVAAGRDGDITDITSYKHPKNGGWTGLPVVGQSVIDFDQSINDPANYYSNNYDSVNKVMVPMRTVNDVYEGILAGASPTETDFGIPGAIKDATFDGTNVLGKLELVDGKYFAKQQYSGIGRPSFIYCQRNTRFMGAGSEVNLANGTTSGTTDLESKITFTIVMPEQQNGEFYPYNGYTLKMAGLFADARMLLGNTVPNGNIATDGSAGEFANYQTMPCGIMWAKRKIAPIYKSHDVKITAQWTIYL